MSKQPKQVVEISITTVGNLDLPGADGNTVTFDVQHYDLKTDQGSQTPWLTFVTLDGQVFWFNLSHVIFYRLTAPTEQDGDVL